MRHVIAAVVAGAIVFAVNFASWMFLPYHGQSLHELPGGEKIAADLKAAGAANAVYHWPAMPQGKNNQPPTKEEMEAFEKQYGAGPAVSLLVFRPQLGKLMSPEIMGANLAANVGAGFILALVLAAAARGGVGYFGRVLMSLGFGLFAALQGPIPEALWWGQPPEYFLTTVADLAVGWFAAGVVVAMFYPARELIVART